jgi:hypothetical protein
VSGTLGRRPGAARLSSPCYAAARQAGRIGSRVWDYLLGGKDNFAADRAAARGVLEIMPVMEQVARGGRAFLATAVRYLAAEAGLCQFLDIGTGLPTAIRPAGRGDAAGNSPFHPG